MIPLALKFGADYLAGKKRNEAQDRSDAATNARGMREYNAQLHEEAANMATQNRYLGEIAEAGEQGVAGRTEAFDMMKKANEEDAEARKNLAAAIASFGKTSKEAQLAAAKAKRSGRVAQAVKGTKVKGTGGAGRQNIRGALNTAKATGISRAAETSGMAAGLGAYGADLSREFGEYNQLAAENRALGNFGKWGRQTADNREQLARQDESTRNKVAAGRKGSQTYANRLLGPNFLPYDPISRIDPNTGGLELLSSAAGAYASMYGAGAFKGPTTTTGSGGSIPVHAPDSDYWESGRLRPNL